MSSHTPIHFLLALFIQFLLQPLKVHSATIPQSLGVTNTNATANEDTAQCIDNEGWVGNGIVVNDCVEALREFYQLEVQPRGGQLYEFLQVEETKTTNLPRINSPRRFSYGTCVIDIGMLYIYWPGKITEIKPLFTRTDEATFNMIVNAAISVVSKCVESRREPVAGWIATGQHKSIGVFILSTGSVVDRILRSSVPTPASIGNGTSPLGLIELPGASDRVVTA
ncbi:hypothetical protein BDR22DRAFT_976498 [Usnea florida]